MVEKTYSGLGNAIFDPAAPAKMSDIFTLQAQSIVAKNNTLLICLDFILLAD
jgi:hypothetical protein